MSGGKWTAAWAEFTQKKLPAIRTRWAAALPAILVSLTLLFSIWGIFGVRYVVMTSFLTLVFRTHHRQDFRPRAGSPVKRMPPGCWSWRSCSAGPSGS